MKNLSLSCSIAFAALMLFQSCSDVGSRQDQDMLEAERLASARTLDENVVESDASHQEEANQKFTKLNEWFGKTENRSGEKTINYPDYYGGSFITMEGKLVVYVTGDVELGKQQIAARIGESNIEFRTAENAYVALTELMKRLSAYVNANRETSPAKDVVGLSLREMENNIVVYVLNLEERTKRSFKNTLFDHPAVDLQKTDELFIDEVGLNPGSRIDGPPGGYKGSIVFSAVNSIGQVGFVTTGHLFSLGGSAYRNGKIVGTVTHNKNSGSVDAAFVKLSNPSVDYVTNTIDGTSSLLSVSTSSPGVGPSSTYGA